MRIKTSSDFLEIKIYGLKIIRKQNVHELYQTQTNIWGCRWKDELSDPDWFFPSCPHLHSANGLYKLNVYNGELYNVKTNSIEKKLKVGKKELKKLWNDKHFVTFVSKMREMFKKEYPDADLPNIPVFDTKRQILHYLTIHKRKI